VYVRSFQDTNIWRIDTTAAGVSTPSRPTLVISSTRADDIPQLSADGRKVTFMSGRSGEWEVWASDVSGANAVQLTSLAANPGFPRWSPKADLVAFHSNAEDGPGDIYVVSGDGGKPRNLTAHPANDSFPSFSSDGQWIYFTSLRGGPSAIWKMPVTGGNPVQVSPNNARRGIESPDGQYLYYVEGTADAVGALWQLPLRGGNPVKVAEAVDTISFEVVAGGIYYIDRMGDARLEYLDVASRRTTTIADKIGPSGFGGLGASRDGRTIVFSRVDSSVDDLMLVENFH
jgi:Tol biopolymer transport system component